MHLERSTAEERSSKSKKVHSRTYDDFLKVTVSEGDTDDIQITSVDFLKGRVPAYLPMEEILGAFEAEMVKEEVTFELFSPTRIEGNFDFGLCRVFSKGGKLYMNTPVNTYNVDPANSARTRQSLRFSNLDIKKDHANDLVKILALSLATTIEFEPRSYEVPPQQEEPLKQTQKTHLNGVQFFHEAEQRIDHALITALLDGYSRVTGENLLRLKRALRWVEKYKNQTASDYLLHTAIMLEALSPQEIKSECMHCHEKKYAESMTQSYVNFITKYSDLDVKDAKNYAKMMYDVRSRISHDGKLLPYDDPAMKLRKRFFLFGMSAPRLFLGQWVLRWIEDQASTSV